MEWLSCVILYDDVIQALFLLLHVHRATTRGGERFAIHNMNKLVTMVLCVNVDIWIHPLASCEIHHHCLLSLRFLCFHADNSYHFTRLTQTCFPSATKSSRRATKNVLSQPGYVIFSRRPFPK